MKNVLLFSLFFFLGVSAAFAEDVKEPVQDLTEAPSCETCEPAKMDALKACGTIPAAEFQGCIETAGTQFQACSESCQA
jgi:hypothetical protein